MSESEGTERVRPAGTLQEGPYGGTDRLRVAFEKAPIGVVLKDPGGRPWESNPAFGRMLGYSEEELRGMVRADFTHPEDVEKDAELYEELLRGERESFQLEKRYVRKDGSVIWGRLSASLVDAGDGEPPFAFGVAEDITERKKAEEALKESEERYRTVVEQSMEGMWLFDPDNKEILESNTAFQEMLGYTAQELQEMTNYDFAAHSREDIDSTVRRIVQEGRGFFGERKYRCKDGTVLDLEVSGAMIPYKGKEVVCGVARDLTERKALEEQLRYQAFHDSLTGLPNRALFLERLEHALARTRREGGPVAVLLLDLNEFKRVNDSLGHDAGNAVLIGLAERLKGSLRPGDTVGRIFGDEFVVLLEAPAGEEEAKRVTERIHEALQSPFEVDGHEVFVSPSIGIALGESEEDKPKEVLRHADLAMYAAKSRGRAQSEVFDPNMDIWAQERMELENELRRAVEREEFEVHYQPKVLLENGEIVGVEALVRWRHPDRGLLSASQFVAPAEEIGLIDQIGLWVLRESCRQFKEWQERYPKKLGTPFDLCVNLSAREIRQSDLTEKVAGVLGETGLDPGCLIVEITERTAKEDVEQTIAKLKELKDLGVELAIDDFGTGYCSLVYLEHSLLDFLKIDRLLVQRAREDPEECTTIISAMTSMAHSLGLAVIVEGVETEEELAPLKEIGCEMVQGHYFAKALPSEAAEKLLEEGISW